MYGESALRRKCHNTVPGVGNQSGLSPGVPAGVRQRLQAGLCRQVYAEGSAAVAIGRSDSTHSDPLGVLFVGRPRHHLNRQVHQPLTSGPSLARVLRSMGPVNATRQTISRMVRKCPSLSVGAPSARRGCVCCCKLLPQTPCAQTGRRAGQCRCTFLELPTPSSWIAIGLVEAGNAALGRVGSLHAHLPKGANARLIASH
jgi:hypothetical protein